MIRKLLACSLVVGLPQAGFSEVPSTSNEMATFLVENCSIVSETFVGFPEAKRSIVALGFRPLGNDGEIVIYTDATENRITLGEPRGHMFCSIELAPTAIERTDLIVLADQISLNLPGVGRNDVDGGWEWEIESDGSIFEVQLYWSDATSSAVFFAIRTYQ